MHVTKTTVRRIQLGTHITESFERRLTIGRQTFTITARQGDTGAWHGHVAEHLDNGHTDNRGKALTVFHRTPDEALDECVRILFSAGIDIHHLKSTVGVAVPR
jgi:hypothetical protein